MIALLEQCLRDLASEAPIDARNQPRSFICLTEHESDLECKHTVKHKAWSML